VRQTKGQSANIPTPRRCERTRVPSDRRAGERSVGNGFWLEDVLPHVGVGSLTTLRRTRAGAGSSAECVRFGEKGRCTCGLRQRRRTRENSSERAYETTGTYPEPHQVSEMSSLWPNGRKWAREFGKIDPYLRYKDWLWGSCGAVPGRSAGAGRADPVRPRAGSVRLAPVPSVGIVAGDRRATSRWERSSQSCHWLGWPDSLI